MSLADKNEAVASTLVLFATIGGIGALALGMGLGPLLVCAVLLPVVLGAFNDGLKQNPYSHGYGGSGRYRGHGHRRGQGGIRR
jgi:hypothetical protein